MSPAAGDILPKRHFSANQLWLEGDSMEGAGDPKGCFPKS
jgi:hypothetical protein